MILNNGEDWQPEPEDVEIWKKAYPAVNYEDEWRKMEAWIISNPRRAKTPKGVKRFVNSWLARAQDRGGSSPELAKSSRFTEVKKMTLQDELTHNFTGDPAIREHFLSTQGQCYEAGKRYER